MSIAYEKKVSPTAMLNGRRRAWRVEPNRFEVISRDSTERYSVEVLGGMPICNCTAAHFGRHCWHAALVLARLEREGQTEPEPTDAELFAMVGGGA